MPNRCYEVILCFNNFGPYHIARLAALHSKPELRVIPLQISSSTSTYNWSSYSSEFEISTLSSRDDERAIPLIIFFRALYYFLASSCNIVLLPSYSPARNTALLIAAKISNKKLIMMNDSHQATAKASGISLVVKKFLVRLFNAAVVAGRPQRRYFSSIGMSDNNIFTPYDVVDNEHFKPPDFDILYAGKLNKMYKLKLSPFFLNISRHVPKKNISFVIKSYQIFCKYNSERAIDLSKDIGSDHLFLSEFPFLLLAGSGPETSSLIQLAENLDLNVFLYDKTFHEILDLPYPSNMHQFLRTARSYFSANSMRNVVLFLGDINYSGIKRLYHEAFFFILASTSEEWGLVVNEAMASSLPILLSARAGCCEDLMDLDPSFNLESSVIDWKVTQYGCVFDPHNSRSLVNCFNYVLQLNKRDYFSISSNCIRKISHYSPMAFADAVLASIYSL
jgi:1,2-diacylglycerol 3-alpha-glucosyltransferase